ncbi:PREDICTED: uncharacterized protein LOC101313541 [Fragaria vesca subsp. vesca]|uniref:uncharacterized protein LOC101313541 n=1 Tax=Fragaria vesca subsp. vesca TaxID=101020 RepID=UPI0002C35B7F|nr:PREDICTED: uncharacterized protein LOC101313541 [Fragaria vesca subsp. vesca]
MLQGIGNLPRFKGVIEKAKSFTIYIYAHHKTLALMRKYTKKRDIVRPGVTRFATAFLTLQSLMEKKNELRAMITSSEWSETKHAKSVKGKAAMNIALSASFWNGVSLSLKVFAPLVKVLRIVDGDRKPSMGFVYGELIRAKEEIKKVFKDQEAHYRPILDIVDAKARDRLDSPLHVAAYLLNPYYTFADPSLENDEVVMDGFFTCVEKLFPDIQTQNLVINIELHKYLKKEGLFGRNVAKEGCKQNDDAYDPVGWWNLYGNNVPTLKKMAKRILALTTSSSGCERNWSAFEGIHTKKRNRLDTTRLNNLVYVQFNARILNKKRREKEKNVDVLIASEANMAQGWIVDGGDDDVVSDLPSERVGEESGVDGGLEPRRGPRIQEIRELDEDDFISDDEEEIDDL